MNAKHQFKYTYNETDLEDFSPLEVIFEMPAEISLPQMLNNFERYLQACGFVFDGRLDFVEDGYDLPDEESEYGCMADWEEESLQKLNEWNEGIANLEAEVKKNKWLDGLFNPPSPDWKKS